MSHKERKKFECQETIVSCSQLATRAITFITKKARNAVGGQMINNKYFYSISDSFRLNSILYKPRRTLQTVKLKEQNNKASVH